MKAVEKCEWCRIDKKGCYPVPGDTRCQRCIEKGRSPCQREFLGPRHPGNREAPSIDDQSNSQQSSARQQASTQACLSTDPFALRNYAELEMADGYCYDSRAPIQQAHDSYQGYQATVDGIMPFYRGTPTVKTPHHNRSYPTTYIPPNGYWPSPPGVFTIPGTGWRSDAANPSYEQGSPNSFELSFDSENKGGTILSQVPLETSKQKRGGLSNRRHGKSRNQMKSTGRRAVQ